jgi:ABC-type glutathione transport system ATPase component
LDPSIPVAIHEGVGGDRMLEVKNLSIAFKTGSGLRPAVRDMSFAIQAG